MNGTTPNTPRKGDNKPTHEVKLKHQHGEKASYEKIGAAWLRDDGTLYVKLIGTQLVTAGFTLYPNDEAAR